MNSVYIIIVNYNGWSDTIECLESVFRNSYPDYRVLVVDNASPNGSLDRIRAWAEGRQEVAECGNSALRHLSIPPIPKPLPHVLYSRAEAESGGRSDESGARLVLIQSGGNLGFAGGNNVALRYALARNDCDYVWLLNNDTVIAADALRELVAVARKESSLAVFGSLILYYRDPTVIQAAGGSILNPFLMKNTYYGGMQQEDRFVTDENIQLTYIMGASLFVKRNVFQKIGLLETKYFLGCEETDFCTAVRRKGGKLRIASQSRIWHKDSATIGLHSALSDYYGTRNSVWYLKKYFWYAVPSAVIIGFIGKVINRIRRRQFKRIWLIILAYRDGILSRDKGTDDKLLS
jgi:GT2 family glycosyltransferase